MPYRNPQNWAAIGGPTIGFVVAAANDRPGLATALAIFAAVAPYLMRAFNAWLANRGKSREEQIRAMAIAMLSEHADENGNVNLQQLASRYSPTPSGSRNRPVAQSVKETPSGQ